ncbi:bifunctional DNA-formamidopyrimidine glycosylase/DNA-(apurinic or apyrimidinic site) lyase [Candidatus Collierbacteria bacterium]|nr:bifunctional DNA-formamidopyrimidine glycosylase/DNA-(apurinic or apyrimidinic site) lyase [Candidatus Collierbacteria bacterium]
MPELPEVETISRQLNSVLSGKRIEKVLVLRNKSFFGDEKELAGKKISSVRRKSKMIIFDFSDWDKKMIVHLKLTGQLVYLSGTHRVVGGHPTPDWVNELPSKHTRVIFDLYGGAKLFFNDLRVFGWVKLVTDIEWQRMLDKLPPDVIDKEFTLSFFGQVLRSSWRPVKLMLLDQSKFGGIGNIYANDALYLARIHPKRKAKDLSQDEIKKLYSAVKKVIDLGIKYGGASDNTYVNAAGLGGKYQEHFLIYGRDGKTCSRCGNKIKKIRLGGRGTFFCPECQREND